LLCVKRALAHVDRAQPKAPQGDLEQCAESFDSVDAPLGA
jgi:hypothetical protein